MYLHQTSRLLWVRVLSSSLPNFIYILWTSLRESSDIMFFVLLKTETHALGRTWSSVGGIFRLFENITFLYRVRYSVIGSDIGSIFWLWALWGWLESFPNAFLIHLRITAMMTLLQLNILWENNKAMFNDFVLDVHVGTSGWMVKLGFWVNWWVKPSLFSHDITQVSKSLLFYPYNRHGFEI